MGDARFISLLLVRSLLTSAFAFVLILDRERDIELATGSIRSELEQARTREEALKDTLKQVQQQLADAKTGLLAAARISDQLEISQVTVASLKAECKYRTAEGASRR